MTSLPISDKITERFWSRVDKSGECWLWTGGTANGYGVFWNGVKDHGVHRVSYEIAYGPIAEGLVIDHTCFTKLCVNPAHLRAITNKQNIENRAGLNVNNSSGMRGVRKRSDCNRWQAVVMQGFRVEWTGRIVVYIPVKPKPAQK